MVARALVRRFESECNWNHRKGVRRGATSGQLDEHVLNISGLYFMATQPSSNIGEVVVLEGHGRITNSAKI